MTLPDPDSLNSLGGALNDYAPLQDASTDRPASAVNVAYADVAAMTHTATRSWFRFTGAATTGALVLVAHDALWGNGAPVAPTLARSSTGVFTATYPTTVQDEIPPGAPGYNASGHTLNFRAGRANSRGAATLYMIHVVPTSANVLTIYVWKYNAGTFALDDGVGVDFDVWGL